MNTFQILLSSINDVKNFVNTVSKYDYEEKRVKEEDKVITETVKLPVTFDSGAILFTVLGIIIIALAILIFIRVKSNKKAENK